MPPSDADDDLRDQVEELEATLAELRSELRRRDGDRDDRAGTGRGPVGRRPAGERARDAGEARSRSTPARPRPPSLSELFRFTEQYTLPTLISTLEAAIQSLELLRGVLRLADPERSAFGPDSRSQRSSATRLTDGVAGVGREAVTGVGRGAVTGVERALSELQTALSESEFPEDDPSRDLLEDARRLSEEVSDRLAEASGEVDRDRGSRRPSDHRVDSGGGASTSADRSDGSGPVEIDVTEAGAEREPDSGDSASPADAAGDDRNESDAPDVDASAGTSEIDVEAELASIKEEVEPRGGGSGAVDAVAEDEPAETADGDGDRNEAAAEDAGDAVEGDSEDETGIDGEGDTDDEGDTGDTDDEGDTDDTGGADETTDVER
ncbi:DUF7547 family protein [Halobellus litoreus]|uniref:Uncharacterized protein n=1 Tax=Halobellus litoreus TaxID=755310 RepID=A0ABD6E0A9_9EURY|nr:hypothetical protein [Halobellus litoreus]